MSETAPPPAPAVAAPASAPPPPPLRTGRVSLESANEGGRYVSVAAGLGVLDATGTDRAARRLATFDAVAGLSDRTCFTFRTADGKHLRHQQWRLRTSTDQGTSLARGDATFCTRDGETTGSVSLESANYPGWFLCRRGNELWVDQPDGTAAFRVSASFRPRPSLSG
jgi:hypothetical protein